MNLQQIREKYPQYKNVSDADLVKGLHQKHYSSMPFAQFSKQIGYTPPAGSVEKKWYDPSGLARTALGQGALMGWGDEAEAAFRSKVLKQGNYQDNLNKIRADVEAYKRDNPVTATAAEIGGGLATGLGGVGVARGVAKGLGLGASKLGANTITRNAALGAGAGAVAGAGGSEEGDRLTGAAIGAGIGGVGGAVIPKVISGAGHAFRGAKRYLSPESSGRIGAEEQLVRGLSESNMTPAQMKAVLARDAQLGVPTRVLDVGQGVTDLATGVASLPGRGRGTVISSMEPRIESARQRIAQVTHKDIGGGHKFVDKESELMRNLRTKAKDAYDTAYAKGEVKDPKVLDYFKNPYFQEALEASRKIANDEKGFASYLGEDPSKMTVNAKLKILANGELAFNKKPDVRTLDYVKKALDERIAKEWRDGNSNLASRLKQTKNAFLKDLDNAVPEYGEARRQYAGDAEMMDALEFGRKQLFKGEMSPDQLRKVWDAAGPAEREVMKIGAAENINNMLGSTKTSANAAKKVFGSEYNRDKIKLLFGDDKAFDDFAEKMRRESQLFEHTGQVYAGSQTAPRRSLANALTEQESALGETFGTLNDIKGLNIPGVAGRADRALAKSDYVQRRTENLGDLLTIPADNPKAVDDLTERLASRGRALEKRDRAFNAAEHATNVAQAGYVNARSPFGYAESLEESEGGLP